MKTARELAMSSRALQYKIEEYGLAAQGHDPRAKCSHSAQKLVAPSWFLRARISSTRLLGIVFLLWKPLLFGEMSR